MVVISGYLRFRPEDRDDVLAGLRQVAERSRQDPGCIDYWWAEDVEEPDTCRFFECWESQVLFEEHRAQPYEDEFMRHYVTKTIAADAHIYDIGDRRSAMGA